MRNFVSLFTFFSLFCSSKLDFPNVNFIEEDKDNDVLEFLHHPQPSSISFASSFLFSCKLMTKRLNIFIILDTTLHILF